jgi:S-adenosylmethionine:tRNA ribosyltransferase-isomerase
VSFSFVLPQARIAQRPCYPPESAKMLVINKTEASIQDSFFSAFPDLLRTNDLIIFNDSKVIPARLFGRKGDLEVEILLLKEKGNSCWEAIGRPLRRLKVGAEIDFANGLRAVVTGRPSAEKLELQFFCASECASECDSELASAERVLADGLMPIPPYIREGISDQQDKQDYQTIFAKNEGSIAAPTASLHFSEKLIQSILDKGVEIDFLTLHVGLSSIKEVEPGKAPASESFSVSAELKERIKNAKAKGSRVIAVGTTVVRALESCFDNEFNQETDLFIKPGYQFKVVDAVVTNFHMPASTHLLLVEAFMGSEQLITKSYQHALDHDYRFFSYGDGMFIYS